MKLEDLLKYVGVHPEKLNKRISDDHICEIALFLTEWKTVAPFLGLDENELDTIEEEGKKEQVKKLKALQKWKSKTGFQATYGKVVQVLLKLEKADVAEKVCHLLKENDRSVPSSDSKELQSRLTVHGNSTSTGLTSALAIQPSFQKLNSSEQDELMAKLYDDEESMKLQFGSLVTETCYSVQRNVSIDIFRASILALRAYEPTPGERDRSLLGAHSGEIQAAKSNAEIFPILYPYMNYLNYEILEYIINGHGTSDDHVRLKNYREKLTIFCERRIFEVPMLGRDTNNTSPNQVKFVVKFDKPEGITIKESLQIRKQIAKILHITVAAFVIYRVDVGCVQLTFLIPEFVSQEIIPLSCEQTSVLSKDVSVIWLKCGQYIYKNISEKYNEGAVTQSTTLVGVEDVSGQIQKQPHAEWPEDAAQHKTSGESHRTETKVQEKDTEIERLQALLQVLEVELQQKDDQIKVQDMEIREKVAQINRQQRELQALRDDRERLHTEMDASLVKKDLIISRLQEELQTLRGQITVKGERLAEVQSQLQQLQAEMNTRNSQVQQLQESNRQGKDQTTSRDGSIAELWSPYVNLYKYTPSNLRLKCRQLPDMPEAMEWPQSVIVHGNVYVREGFSYIIHRYNPQTQQWTKLPNYQYWNFTMAEFNHQLTLVGGWLPGKTSDAVAVYSISQRKWQQPYPPMHAPRALPAVATYYQHLVVSGGCDDTWTDLASVEILNMSTHHGRWLKITPLPMSCRLMSSVIIHDSLYLLGGSLGKQVLRMPLPGITQTVEQPAPQWHILSNAPLENSAAVTVHGSLLTVGGSHDEQLSSAIHVYHHKTNMWSKVGDLPTEQEDCACCLLSNEEILVAGGHDCNGWSKRMDITVVNY